MENKVAEISIHRPDKLNALDPATVQDLATAFHAAVSDPDVKGVILSGSGKAFVAGADVAFFVNNLT